MAEPILVVGVYVCLLPSWVVGVGSNFVDSTPTHILHSLISIMTRWQTNLSKNQIPEFVVPAIGII
jgi:hypothetical protein